MKRFKFLAVAALLVSALAVTFAFTTNHKSAKKATRVFVFVGTTTNSSDLIDPSKWIENPAGIQSDDVDNFVSDLVIPDASQATYIYTTGTFAGKPKVDNTSLNLRADALLAGGHGSPASVQEVIKTDYQILTNSVQRVAP